MFRLFQSRLVWLTIGVLTLAGTASWMVAAIVAAVMTKAAGGNDPDPDQLANVAVPLGMLAALAMIVVCVVLMVMMRRGRTRQWVPLREQMIRDAATQPATHLMQVISPPNPAAGGQVLAIDLITRHQVPLWIPGATLPRGAVVSVTLTAGGGQVRAWMTGQLWRATTREAARIERRSTRAFAKAEHEQHEAEEQQIRYAAGQAVAEAEQILPKADAG
jgi:hypothetical protein